MRPAAVTVFGGPTSRSAFDVWLAWMAGGCVFTRSVEDSGRTAFFLHVVKISTVPIPQPTDPTPITCCGREVQIVSARPAVTYWYCMRCGQIGGTRVGECVDTPRRIQVPARRIG